MRFLPLHFSIFLLLTLATSLPSFSADPEWLWSNGDPKETETVYFRKTFELKGKPKAVVFSGSCDNVFTLFVNGQMVTQGSEWSLPVREKLEKRLVEGKNVIAVRGANQGSAAGFIAIVDIENADGSKQQIVTDKSWLVAAEAEKDWQQAKFDDSAWKKPHSFGKLGVGPWGNVALDAARPGGILATTEENIKPIAGFKVELLYSVPKDEQGSWVSMTPDPKGRLIVSDQYGSLYRVTPGKDRESTKVEKLEVEIGEAHGMLHVGAALYVVNNEGQKYKRGLYRVTDTNGDDQYDKVELLKAIDGGGEHGPHAVRLGPDGKLYLVAGNFTKPPEGYASNSPHRNWAEDQLLLRNPDGGGHDPHIFSPAGWVARCDLDGKNWELLCGGLRNTYDIDFNTDGELFNFDSDMEWDTGTPWYRPTRVNHIVSGGEYGWRNGTGKWMEYSPDSLGAVANIGLGSPTGVTFGTGAKFPAKYQRAFFINDWTYGKIYAVHMTPTGSTYIGNFETFIEGKPLPVTDIVVNTDGAIYFAIGGRRTQSGLYRVTYIGSESTAPAEVIKDEAAAKARELRHSIEAFHMKEDPKAIEVAWPHLNSNDRAIRYAARIAIEHQDPKLWQDKALSEQHTTAAIHAMVALARTGKRGDKALLEKIVTRLSLLPWEKMTEDQFLAAIRACGLAFIRLHDLQQDPGGLKPEQNLATIRPAKPDPKLAAALAGRIAPLFPNQSENVNHELAALLVYLEAPAVVAPGMKLLATSQTQEDQLHYVLVLRNVSHLMTSEQRRAFFSWIPMAQQSYRGGNSFRKFLDKIRDDAAAKLSDADRLALKDVIEGKARVEVVKLETTRQFVHNWQMEDLLPELNAVEKGRSFEKGKIAYQAAQCYKCHRFNGDGGDTGPDITGVGNRFNPTYILESLIVPSKAISDQYLNTTILTTDGEVFNGRILDENAKQIKLRPDPFAKEPIVIEKENIQNRQLSKVSEMPQGLISTLTKEEVLDLVAYLRSAGKAEDKAFGK
ncbi:MAG: c-type cytochrome [Pirellulaceae bacterium]